MGGRGAIGKETSISKETWGMIVNDNQIEIKATRRGTGSWSESVWHAFADKQKGVLNFRSFTPDEYKKISRTQQEGIYKLSSGIYTSNKRREIKEHNLNLEKVKAINGSTYEMREYLKTKGFTEYFPKAGIVARKGVVEIDDYYASDGTGGYVYKIKT